MKFSVFITVKPVFKGHLNIREKVSLHDRCPFVTDSLTWERWDTVLRKCPLITGCPLIAVSLEDRFYCIKLHVCEAYNFAPPPPQPIYCMYSVGVWCVHWYIVLKIIPDCSDIWHVNWCGWEDSWETKWAHKEEYSYFQACNIAWKFEDWKVFSSEGLDNIYYAGDLFILEVLLGRCSSPVIACWSSDHWVAGSNPGMFHH